MYHQIPSRHYVPLVLSFKMNCVTLGIEMYNYFHPEISSTESSNVTVVVSLSMIGVEQVCTCRKKKPIRSLFTP